MKVRVIIKSEFLLLLNLIKNNKPKHVLFRLVAFIYRLISKKQIWIISDRLNVAGDNGEAFFKYVVKQKNKKFKPYFLISKDSPDYKRLNKIGKVLSYGSIKHKILFLSSPYIISSHADDLVINPFGKQWPYYANYYDYKFIFLQHGIIQHDMSNWLNKKNKNIHIFVTSTTKEYESIINGNYLYSKKETKLVGLPRYDFLNSKSNTNLEKIILVAPTWRKKLVHELNSKSREIKLGERPYNKKFVKSDYYKHYKSLLNNDKLLLMLKKHGIKLHFVLHPAIIQQRKDFKVSGNIIIKENVNYKDEFEKATLLITDYSSVAFDFAYLKKPIIYFQFDKQNFFEKQIYTKGYFSYEKDGFGDIFTTVEEVIKKIEFYFKNGFKMEDKYINRVNKTFKYTDKNNCKRLYEEIISFSKDFEKTKQER